MRSCSTSTRRPRRAWWRDRRNDKEPVVTDVAPARLRPTLDALAEQGVERMADTSISNGTYGTTLPPQRGRNHGAAFAVPAGNVYHQLPVPNSNDAGDATLPGAGCVS